VSRRLAHDVVVGQRVVLEPLSLEHLDALTAIGAGPNDSFALTFVPRTAGEMRSYVDEALAQAERDETRAFAIRERASNRIVGSTRLAHLEHWTWPASSSPARDREGTPDAAEIGWTFLEPTAQGTGINTEAKRLLLGLAFEEWRVERVTLISDVRNTRSRKAIERLGAHFDGIQRAHFPAADGTIRDSATYSILTREWPAVRDGLDARIHAIAR
jgi:RimJ/RimL family protein N-acetyltransferase